MRSLVRAESHTPGTVHARTPVPAPFRTLRRLPTPRRTLEVPCECPQVSEWRSCPPRYARANPTRRLATSENLRDGAPRYGPAHSWAGWDLEPVSYTHLTLP